MNNLLKNIFVSKEVAKLAFEKGFKQWCPAITSDIGITANVELMSEFNFNHIVQSDEVGCYCYNLPTHFQLMMWLNTEHSISIKLTNIGTFSVYYKGSRLFYRSDGNYYFNIDVALVIALNLIPHDTKK